MANKKSEGPLQSPMRDHVVDRLFGTAGLSNRARQGVFSSTSDILRSFKDKCALHQIDRSKFSWVTSKRPLGFTRDDEVVVVLDITLDTLQHTIDFAWKWITDGQEDWVRYEDSTHIGGKTSHYELIQGLEFKPWTLSWRRIKLDANVGRRPGEVRNPETSPACALMFVAAQHPVRVKAMNSKGRPNFWIPGLVYLCMVDSEGGFEMIPRIGRSQGPWLIADGPFSHGSDGMAVPVYVK